VIVALDLDDTLYPEESYVRSGFRAVASTLAARWQVEEERAFSIMWEPLERDGRGAQFDRVVAELGLSGRQSVAELVRVLSPPQTRYRAARGLPCRDRAAPPAAALRCDGRAQGGPTAQDRRARLAPTCVTAT
jgi:hypothetical protein